MVLYKANASAWPTDRKQILAITEGVVAGADQLIKTGAVKEIGWFTTEAGYAILEANSKEAVLQTVAPYFPLYSQDIQEIVSWEKGKEALLAAARMAAGSR